jgi:hypothetical protein
VAQCLTWFFRGAASGLFIGFGQALFGLLFALEALSAFVSGVHVLRIPAYGSGVQ